MHVLVHIRIKKYETETLNFMDKINYIERQ